MPSRTLTLRLTGEQAAALDHLQSQTGETAATKAIAQAVAAHPVISDELRDARLRVSQLEDLIRDVADSHAATLAAREAEDQALEQLRATAQRLDPHLNYAIGSRRRRSPRSPGSLSR